MRFSFVFVAPVPQLGCQFPTTGFSVQQRHATSVQTSREAGSSAAYDQQTPTYQSVQPAAAAPAATYDAAAAHRSNFTFDAGPQQSVQLVPTAGAGYQSANSFVSILGQLISAFSAQWAVSSSSAPSVNRSNGSPAIAVHV